MANTLLALSLNHNCNDQTKRLLLSLSMCLGEWCMKLEPAILLQPCSQPDSPPLLTTVFRVLQAVATGSASVPAVGRPLDLETDAPVDNIGEHLSTRSPPQSPISSPSKNPSDGYNQRGATMKTTATPSEAEANLRSVRLAARMVNQSCFLV